MMKSTETTVGADMGESWKGNGGKIQAIGVHIR